MSLQIIENMKQIIYIVSLIVIFNSCTTTNIISIDVLNPAALTVSTKAENQNIIIVDNTPPNNEEVDNQENIASLSVDSARTTMLYSLVKFMNEESYFNNVDIYPYRTRDDSVAEKTKLLTTSEVMDICRETSTDALISVDEFVLYGEIDQSYDHILEMKIGTALRIYSPSTGRMIQPPIIYTDSLYWFNTYSSKQVDDAISEISTIAADKLASIFVPSWEKQTRWYYSDGSNEMKQADKLVKDNKWKEAAVIWGTLFDKEEKNSRKIKLASNIALANECLDDIPNAVIWINIAYDLSPESSNAEYVIKTTLYREILKKRETNISELKEQLGEEI